VDWSTQEEEEEIYLTQIRNNHDNTNSTEPDCQTTADLLNQPVPTFDVYGGRVLKVYWRGQKTSVRSYFKDSRKL